MLKILIKCRIREAFAEHHIFADRIPPADDPFPVVHTSQTASRLSCR